MTSSDAWWGKRNEEEPSRSLMSLTASCSLWKIACGGCPPIMEKGERRTASVDGGAELAGNRTT